MNHDRFIELLNLYLDGELSREDSVELEREITTNPERRKIYRQYCQMQRACALMAEKFRDAAETPDAAPEGNVIEFPGRRPAVSWARGLALVGTGAVAAGFVFVALQGGLSPKPGTTVAATPAPAVAVREQAIPVTSFADSANALQPMFRLQGDRTWLAGATDATDTPASLFSAVPPLPNGDKPTMIRANFRSTVPAPMLIEPLRFESEPEMNAIQFNR